MSLFLPCSKVNNHAGQLHQCSQEVVTAVSTPFLHDKLNEEYRTTTQVLQLPSVSLGTQQHTHTHKQGTLHLSRYRGKLYNTMTSNSSLFTRQVETTHFTVHNFSHSFSAPGTNSTLPQKSQNWSTSHTHQATRTGFLLPSWHTSGRKCCILYCRGFKQPHKQSYLAHTHTHTYTSGQAAKPDSNTARDVTQFSTFHIAPSRVHNHSSDRGKNGLYISIREKESICAANSKSQLMNE